MRISRCAVCGHEPMGGKLILSYVACANAYCPHVNHWLSIKQWNTRNALIRAARKVAFGPGCNCSAIFNAVCRFDAAFKVKGKA